MTRTKIWKNTYFDSVTLMLASQKLEAVEGVSNAAIMMGTAHNRALMERTGLITPETAFEPNDTVIGIIADDEAAADRAERELEEFFAAKKTKKEAGAAARPKAVDKAVQIMPDANLALISVPGRYAATEARKALRLGLHVLLFSDNVSLENEIELKKIAVEKGLLMMGPDCGTAIISGTALGFANVIRRGNIGIVAAAGTGLQEVCVLVDRFGGGVSQALGAGGRDICEEVGGLMMLQEIKALLDDDATKVLVIVSKPPHPSVAQKIKELLKQSSKPAVACLLGSKAEDISADGIAFADSLEQAARLAVELSGIGDPNLERTDDETLDRMAEELCAGLAPEQHYLRALYAGGTLCYETMLLLADAGIPVWSNITHDEQWRLSSPDQSCQHTMVDMGDDYFTDGRPHPMIDPSQRVGRIRAEGDDPETAIMLLDIVCGYGSGAEPVRDILPAIEDAKKSAERRGGKLVVIASVCGTEADPQPLSEQRKLLQQAGATVVPCNTTAAKLAIRLIRKIENGRRA